MPNTKLFKLHDGHALPRAGFGVWRVENAIVADVVRTAIETGWRLIDTAAIYGNEAGVGEAVQTCGLPRKELFVTTKIWNDSHGYDAALKAFDASLERLALDYVDLCLIHWPVPQLDLYPETWKAMIQLRDEGRIKSIGVSNFHSHHIQRLLDETGVLPVINQIELHPRFQQPELRQFHLEHGIITAAWSPLGHSRSNRESLWQHPVLREIATRLHRSIAQIILRWQIQLGNMVISKSITPARIRENFVLFDFTLTAADMAAIAALHDGQARMGPEPQQFYLG